MKLLQNQRRKHDARRRLIQIAAFGFTNCRVGNLATGKIYRGSWKHFCAPGLNCYSCPAAALSCPIGAIQAVESSPRFGVSFYLLGFLLAVGVLLGRAVCGYLCPFGLLQELLHKIPSPKKRLPKPLTRIKYLLLLVFVLLLPALLTDEYGIGASTFCALLCPAGTLEGGLPILLTHPELRTLTGAAFLVKAAILVLTTAGCIIVCRFFCKIMCPLGAIYGLLNKVSFYRVHLDMDKCVSCGTCRDVCPMDVNPAAHPDSAECIRCGRCAAACPGHAIHVGFGTPSPGTEERGAEE